MKKAIMIATVAVAGVVCADLSTIFQNTQIIIDDGSGGLADGAKVQLIWSGAGIQTAGGGQFNVLNGATLGGEFVLAETTTFGSGGAQPAGNGLWQPVQDVYFNSDVGGADINSGFFFTRIFNATGAAGESFLDIGQVDASLWVYDDGSTLTPPAPDPATIYQENSVPGAAFSTQLLNQNGSTVIPEPATIGLMGIAGLGMFLARRKNRR